VCSVLCGLMDGESVVCSVLCGLMDGESVVCSVFHNLSFSLHVMFD